MFNFRNLNVWFIADEKQAEHMHSLLLEKTDSNILYILYYHSRSTIYFWCTIFTCRIIVTFCPTIRFGLSSSSQKMLYCYRKPKINFRDKTNHTKNGKNGDQIKNEVVHYRCFRKGKCFAVYSPIQFTRCFHLNLQIYCFRFFKDIWIERIGSHSCILESGISITYLKLNISYLSIWRIPPNE